MNLLFDIIGYIFNSVLRMSVTLYSVSCVVRDNTLSRVTFTFCKLELVARETIHLVKLNKIVLL